MILMRAVIRSHCSAGSWGRLPALHERGSSLKSVYSVKCSLSKAVLTLRSTYMQGLTLTENGGEL